MKRFGRKLNPATMMWEFAGGKGVSIPDELIPRAGDNICALFEAQALAVTKVSTRPSPLREKHP